MADRVAPFGLTALITGKSPTIEVELPDGRVLDVEASTPEEAGKAAKAFMDNEQAQSRVESERGTLQDVDDRVRSYARGVPFIGGSLDEASAGLNTGFGLLGDYDKEVTYQRARDADFDARHPVESTVGQIGGTIAGTIAGMRFLPKGGGPASIPLSRTGKFLTGTGIGGAGGYTEGFTRGEGGFEDRHEQGKSSGLWGAGFGAASPVVAKVAGAGYNAVAGWLANRGVDAKSINILLDRLKAQGVTPQQAEARIAEMGDQAMLADVTPGMSAFTGGTALADIGAGNTIATRLATRREGGGDRVRGILDDAFGQAADPYTVQQQQRGIRQQAGYDTAFQNAPQLPRSVEDVASAQLTAPAENLSLHGRSFMKGVFDEVDDALAAGNPEVTGRRLHDIRKRLDAQIVYDPRARDALSSADKANQEVLQNARASVDEILKDRYPGFAEADQLSSTSYRNQRAFDEGRTSVLRPGANTMTPAELDARIAASSDPENAFRKQGTRTELDRIMGNSRGNPGARVDRVMDRDWNNRKITSMVGPQKAENLRRGLDAEATFTETSNLAEPARQSRTAIVNAAKDFWGARGPGTLGDMVAAGGATTAVTGSPMAGGAAALGVGANRLRQMLAGAVTRKASPALVQKTAENLTEQGGAQKMLIQALIDKAAELPQRSGRAKNIEELVRALLTAEAGRAGYEGQRLGFGGPR